MRYLKTETDFASLLKLRVKSVIWCYIQSHICKITRDKYEYVHEIGNNVIIWLEKIRKSYPNCRVLICCLIDFTTYNSIRFQENLLGSVAKTFRDFIGLLMFPIVWCCVKGLLSEWLKQLINYKSTLSKLTLKYRLWYETSFE